MVEYESLMHEEKKVATYDYYRLICLSFSFSYVVCVVALVVQAFFLLFFFIFFQSNFSSFDDLGFVSLFVFFFLVLASSHYYGMVWYGN